METNRNFSNNDATSVQLEKTHARLRWNWVSQKIMQQTGNPEKHTTESPCSSNSEGPEKNNLERSLPDISTRRFEHFGLLQRNHIILDEQKVTEFLVTLENEQQEEPVGTRCTKQDENPGLRGGIRVLTRCCSSVTTVADIQGFDNTGNICIWPSEEILAYLCAVDIEQFRNKCICEIGGGMTCLAGNVIAAGTTASTVLLTDGNAKSVTNCMEIVNLNKSRGGYRTDNVKARNLRWDKPEDRHVWRDTFDFIIAADCIFLAEFHSALVLCLYDMLYSTGTALILSPRRGKALYSFVEAASATFNVEVVEKYNDRVWHLHKYHQQNNSNYSPDLHYPLLIILKKKQPPDTL